MRHSVYGRKLSRTKNERRRLLQSLTRELIRRGSIRTTLPKAKAVQSLVEKLVSRSKDGRNAARRAVTSVLSDKSTEQMLRDDAGTRFAGRTSGFTRIVKLGSRAGDGAEEALIQFVDQRVVTEIVHKKNENKEEKKQVTQAKEQAPQKKKRGRPKKTNTLT